MVPEGRDHRYDDRREIAVDHHRRVWIGAQILVRDLALRMMRATPAVVEFFFGALANGRISEAKELGVIYEVFVCVFGREIMC